MKIQLYKFRYAIFYTSFNMQIKKTYFNTL